ncbi:MAG: signal peptidase I [Desulfuromonadales bacterium]|nr:MAG: signal peptidase I [Desulfuromonadales bacterium]
MFGTSFVIGMILVVLVLLVSFWKIYEKAGEPGWASLIPIYNLFVLVKIAGKPWWWFLLMFVPVVGIIISILVYIALAARFGKGVLYGLGLLFLGFIFIPMLAFDKSVYQG